MQNRDTFSSYHPAINFLYFALVLVFSMFFMHPVSLMISLTGAIAYHLYLNGRKALRFQLLFLLPMALMAELNVPHDKVNVHGGACALGHPIGASGARIIVTLIHALQRHGKKKGVATLCIGGGEGTAMAIELL